MKKFIMAFLFSILLIITNAQVNRTEVLQSLENRNQDKQNQQITATLKNASRLFGDKSDLTSVIVVIPLGSVVNVLETDSTYYKVSYEDDQGYIFKRDAVLKSIPVEEKPAQVQENASQNDEQSGSSRGNRFAYLEYKYGKNMAALLIAGKIWKGMSSDMVKDSWGSPLKINRVIGEVVKEEWIYKNSWLFIESDRLIDWGPVTSNKQ
jgi:hypothetical protein